jgi:hypothetical protein
MKKLVFETPVAATERALPAPSEELSETQLQEALNGILRDNAASADRGAGGARCVQSRAERRSRPGGGEAESQNESGVNACLEKPVPANRFWQCLTTVMQNG